MKNITTALRALATPERKKSNERYFKTGPGEYGHGDHFLGVTVPGVQLIAKQFFHSSEAILERLIHSRFHEERLLALSILRLQFEAAAKSENDELQIKLAQFFLNNRQHINNWDLVDSSAPYISGAYWFHFMNQALRMKTLKEFASADSLWDRRIAIISTFYCIRKGSFKETLAVAKLLLNDKHDLIHKAVGWMLREVGKRDQLVLKKFLDAYGKKLPRTSLRYALERLSAQDKEHYLRATRLDSGTRTKKRLPKRSVRPAVTSA